MEHTEAQTSPDGLNNFSLHVGSDSGTGLCKLGFRALNSISGVHLSIIFNVDGARLIKGLQV